MVLLGGSAVGDDSTVGSLTLVDRDVPHRTVVVGSPMLPIGRNRGDMGSGSNRLATGMQTWMLLSSLVPPVTLGLLLGSIRLLFDATIGERSLKAWLGIYALPVAYAVGVCILFVLNVVLLRVPNFSSGQRSLFSAKLVCWELAGHVQGLFSQLFGEYMEGNILIVWFMRACGAKVGSDVFWDTAVPTEVQGLRVGDGVVVEAGAMVLGHTVDHGELNFGEIRIDSGATVSSFCNVQPGAHIGRGTTAAALTLVMKNETLPDHTVWRGSPAVCVEPYDDSVAIATGDHDGVKSGWRCCLGSWCTHERHEGGLGALGEREPLLPTRDHDGV